MDRTLGMLVIGLFFGGGIGFVTAASQGITLDGHDHSAHGGSSLSQHTEAKSGGGQEHGMHLGKPVSVPPGPGAPTLKITVHRDPEAGWNLHVMTTAFRFAPENASKAHVAGEGHAHVYVNGAKVSRLYGPWLHLGKLPAGKAEVKVTLNTNDHRPLEVGDIPLTASKTVITN